MNKVEMLYWFRDLCSDVYELILSQVWQRSAISIFYLLGPFFMLIERSPADAWLSLCGLAFIGRCIYRADWSWTQYFWVRAIFVFWFWCLISAAMSKMPAYSLLFMIFLLASVGLPGTTYVRHCA